MWRGYLSALQKGFSTRIRQPSGLPSGCRPRRRGKRRLTDPDRPADQCGRDQALDADVKVVEIEGDDQPVRHRVRIADGLGGQGKRGEDARERGRGARCGAAARCILPGSIDLGRAVVQPRVLERACLHTAARTPTPNYPALPRPTSQPDFPLLSSRLAMSSPHISPLHHPNQQATIQPPQAPLGSNGGQSPSHPPAARPVSPPVPRPLLPTKGGCR